MISKAKPAFGFSLIQCQVQLRRSESSIALIDVKKRFFAFHCGYIVLSMHLISGTGGSIWPHMRVFYRQLYVKALLSYTSTHTKQADTATATFIKETLRVNHDTLGKVRSLENRFLPMKAILENFVDVLDELKDLSGSLPADPTFSSSDLKVAKPRLENCRKQCLAYSRTAEFLQHRSDNTATFVADILDFKNQDVAQDQNVKMLTLTRSAVFITILTLIYLPWTFVSVNELGSKGSSADFAQGLFGMNFFVFDSTNNRIDVTPQIWIYFISSAGLTLVTLALYYGVTGRFSDGDVPLAQRVPRMALQRRYKVLKEKIASTMV
jgi:hypothetical protein